MGKDSRPRSWRLCPITVDKPFSFLEMIIFIGHIGEGLGTRDTKLGDFKVCTNFEAKCHEFRSPKLSPLYSPVNYSFELGSLAKIENVKEK